MISKSTKLSLNQSSRKIKAYLDNLIRQEDVLKEVSKLRTKLGLPKNGLPIEKDTAEKILDKFISYYPIQLLPSERGEYLRAVNEGVRDITKNWTFKNHTLLFLFKIFVFHNEIPEKVVGMLNTKNGCTLYDHRYDFLELYGNDPEIAYVYTDYLDKETQVYPIGIGMTPFTSQRDLIDFIKKNWDLIKYSQEKYLNNESLVTKIKQKNPSLQRRDDFIYENRDLKIKQIRKLLAEQKIFMDDGHIGKIINLEKKKRKQL